MNKQFRHIIAGLLVLLFFSQNAICDSISNIQLSPDTHSELPFHTDVNITFDYETDEPGGVRIFFRPMTNGVLTSNYSATGSPLYSTGSGSGSHLFTISSGDATVEQLRVKMTNADQSEILYQFQMPVVYVFRSSSSSVSNIRLTPSSPAAIAQRKEIEVNFDYENNESGNIRIFARPMTAGNLTPNYAASGSPAYPPGSGSGTGTFNISSGETRIDEIRFRIYNDDLSSLLLGFSVPVDYKVPVIFTTVPDSTVLSLSKNGTMVTASWTPAGNADGYILGYAPYPGAEYINSIDVGMDTSYSFDFLYGSTTYYFAVIPYNDAGQGPPSNVEVISTP